MADSFFMWACPELDTYKKEFTLFLFFRRVSGFVQQAKYTGQKKAAHFFAGDLRRWSERKE
jgi:hypothetical protein